MFHYSRMYHYRNNMWSISYRLCTGMVAKYISYVIYDVPSIRNDLGFYKLLRFLIWR